MGSSAHTLVCWRSLDTLGFRGRPVRGQRHRRRRDGAQQDSRRALPLLDHTRAVCRT